MNSLYLAGPMSGIREFNFPSFVEAAARLRRDGWVVISPAERDLGAGFDPSGLSGQEPLPDLGLDWHVLMDACLRSVLEVDAVALLPGWERSVGARAEAFVAVTTGRELYGYYKHRPQALEPLDVTLTTRVEVLA